MGERGRLVARSEGGRGVRERQGEIKGGGGKGQGMRRVDVEREEERM